MALRLTRALPSSSSVHRSSHHEAGENERTNDRQLVKTVRTTTSAQSMTPPQTPSHQSSPTVCAILQMGKLEALGSQNDKPGSRNRVGRTSLCFSLQHPHSLSCTQRVGVRDRRLASTLPDMEQEKTGEDVSVAAKAGPSALEEERRNIKAT